MRTARRHSVRRIGILLVVGLLSFLSVNAALALDPTGQPPGVTEEANTMHNLYLFVSIMALIVFVGVEGALVFLMIRFRKRNDELPPQIHGNNTLEVIWTAIPVIIVISLFVAAFIVLVDVEEDAPEEALTIEMEGFQFSWAGTYAFNDLGTTGSDPESDETFTIRGLGGVENEPTFVIPIGEPVEFRLSSNDVIHSFYVRDFLYKLDVVPGRDNRFTVTANQLGTFNGQCAELCGLNHALMRFQIQVVERDEFDEWVAERREEEQQSAARR